MQFQFRTLLRGITNFQFIREVFSNPSAHSFFQSIQIFLYQNRSLSPFIFIDFETLRLLGKDVQVEMFCFTKDFNQNG